MDDRGRLAQPLKGTADRRPADGAPALPRTDHAGLRSRRRLAQVLDRWSWLLASLLPRGAGIAATAILMLASLGYGIVKGDHVATVVDAMTDARDRVGNAAGFRIVSIALSGNQHVSREEVLATAGISGTTSLVFLDVEQTRERLKTNPWI